MRSATGASGTPPPDDQTTRARIRDAAIARFAADGFHRASLRGIAGDAEVSPALIVHHFGGKDGLRRACDEYVVTSLLGPKEEIAAEASPALMRAALDAAPQMQNRLDYLSHMLMETDGSADELFDRLYAGTHAMLERQIADGSVREQEDLETTSAYMLLYGLSAILLRRQLGRALGAPGETGFSPAVAARSTLPILGLFTHGLYTDDRMLRAAREALRDQPGDNNAPSQKGDPA